MKYTKKAVIIAAAVMLSSCSTAKLPETEPDTSKTRLGIENARLFDYDMGVNYAVKEDLSGELAFAQLEMYDDKGDKTGSVTLDNIYASSLHCWDIHGGKIYFAADDWIEGERAVFLYSAEISSGKTEKLICFEGLESINKLAVSGNNVYFLGTDSERQKDYEPFVPEKGENIMVFAANNGEVFGCCDLESGEISESGIDFPVTFDERNGEVIVYAFDSEGGYHFINIADGNKTYTNKLGLITDFELINDRNDYAFINSVNYPNVLGVSGISEDSGVIQISENIWAHSANAIVSAGDFVYVRTNEEQMSFDNCIYKFPVGGINTEEPPIKMISSHYVAKPPFGCGSQISMEQLSPDGFSLKVLSLDKDYDIAVIKTDAPYADSIKKDGCFYPIGEIEAVNRYLDSCLPYIKQAATDESGEVWMLPIEVEIPVIVYNKENCDNAGITFGRSAPEFIEMLETKAENSEYYSCNRYRFVQNCFWGYLRENNSFDTPEFRSLAGLIKESCTTELMKTDYNLYSSIMMCQNGAYDADTKRITDNFLFTVVINAPEQRELLRDTDTLRAAALPDNNEQHTNARCTFLVVNPYSENLEKALEYIEKLSENMCEKTNSFLLSDKSLYTDNPYALSLYEIYENGTISFEIPDEIYYEDFERYCNDEITLDDFIAEADRKLETYINE